MSAEIESELVRLRDSDAETRMGAAAEMGRRRETQAVPALLSLLKDKDFKVRATAVRALGDIGAISSLPSLIKHLKIGHPDVCREAANALNRMGSEQFLPHRILAETSFTPEQRIHLLKELSKIDKGNFYVTVNYTIQDLRQFCRLALTSNEPDVAEGARMTLLFLDNLQTLLRASQRDDTLSSKELLRAAGVSSVTQADSLLRASANDSGSK